MQRTDHKTTYNFVVHCPRASHFGAGYSRTVKADTIAPAPKGKGKRRQRKPLRPLFAANLADGRRLG